MRKVLLGLRQEQGQLLVVSAFVIVALLAFTGLVIDVGFLYAEHRQAQNAADEAALAATYELFYGGSVADATTTALAYADENGFDNVNDNTVTVNIPPLSGEHVGANEVAGMLSPHGCMGAETDAAGRFEIRDVRRGRYVLSRGWAPEDDAPMTEPFEVHAGEDFDIGDVASDA